jgi:methylglutaconyl-CoA hydratase
MNLTQPLVLVETDGPVATVILNRPDKRNALNVEILVQLVAAVAKAEGDPGMRVLILRGEGPVFCAGLDLSEAANTENIRRSAGLIADALLSLTATRLVTIAEVHGAAIAGGAGLMTACDFAVAAEGTKIGYPEPRRGLVASLVMAFLRRQLRERDARELLITGELIGAPRALEMGLVNRVVPEAGLRGEVLRIASSVLAGGPQSVAITKKLLGELWPRSIRADLDRALESHMETRNSPEAMEGIAAFREKRPPNWTRKA